MLAEHAAGAVVVKAFNTMFYATLAEAGRTDAAADERPALFLAGHDPDANRIVAGLIEQLEFTAVDTGGLADAAAGSSPEARSTRRFFPTGEARGLLGRWARWNRVELRALGFFAGVPCVVRRVRWVVVRVLGARTRRAVCEADRRAGPVRRG